MEEQHAQRAREKLRGIVTRGISQAETALQKVQAEKPEDYIVPTGALRFHHDGELMMSFPSGNRKGSPSYQFGLHENGVKQAASKVKLPRRFADDLLDNREAWAQQLLVHNLNTLYDHAPRQKHLVRVAAGEVRGILSDRYRRIDTPRVVGAFTDSVAEYGAVPIQAECLDTKFFLKCAIPEIFEPFPGEPMVLGLHMLNSDYGDGAFEIRQFFMRVWCTNMAVGEDGIRKVHLGGRISDDISISQRTYELDNETIASATRDVVSNMLGRGRITEKMLALKAAAEERIDIQEAIARLRKNDLNKSEAEGVAEVFRNGGVEQLPPGDTTWRLSNAISYFSQQDDVKPTRRLELEQLAGRVAGIAT